MIDPVRRLLLGGGGPSSDADDERIRSPARDGIGQGTRAAPHTIYG
jgi:hypothetical protein